MRPSVRARARLASLLPCHFLDEVGPRFIHLDASRRSESVSAGAALVLPPPVKRFGVTSGRLERELLAGRHLALRIDDDQLPLPQPREAPAVLSARGDAHRLGRRRDEGHAGRSPVRRREESGVGEARYRAHRDPVGDTARLRAGDQQACQSASVWGRTRVSGPFSPSRG